MRGHLLDRARSAWPRVQRFGLGLTAIATGASGATALAAAVMALRGVAPSLAGPFTIAGLGLVVAGALMAARMRTDLVELILGGLAGASFGVTLAEMSAQAATIPDHYKSLWIPTAIGALFVSFLAFKDEATP